MLKKGVSLEQVMDEVIRQLKFSARDERAGIFAVSFSDKKSIGLNEFKEKLIEVALGHHSVGIANAKVPKDLLLLRKKLQSIPAGIKSMQWQEYKAFCVENNIICFTHLYLSLSLASSASLLTPFLSLPLYPLPLYPPALPALSLHAPSLPAPLTHSHSTP